MIDIERVNELADRRADGEFEHPTLFHEYINSFVEALGDDAEEVIKLVEDSTQKQQWAIYEAYEEIMQKFPDDKLNDLIIEKCDVILGEKVDKRWYHKYRK